MIDYHCHILPNIDDGPGKVDDSVAMAKALSDAGFTQVYCTPHLIKGFYEADSQTVKTALHALQDRLDEENINIKLFPGREYYLDEFLGNYLKDPLLLGETRFVMIEIPNHADPDFTKETLFRIKRGGLVPMISHPERCSLLTVDQKKPPFWLRFIKTSWRKKSAEQEGTSLLDYLKDIGCAFQANLGSFAGWYGPDARTSAEYLQQNNFFTHFGTDAHSVRGITRLPAMRPGILNAAS